MEQDLKERSINSIMSEMSRLAKVLCGGAPAPTIYVFQVLKTLINELLRRIKEKNWRIEELEAKIAELESISSPESTKEEE